MEESSALISDLGVVLICAAVVTLLFKKLRLPVFLGYVLAGFLVGPNLWDQSPIHDIATVRSLSELGVVFLMFYIGLEFDIGRLRQVFAPAFLAVTLQTLALIFLGTQVAPLLGWGAIEGLFLGALLAISSSMITISVLQGLGRMNKPHAQLAVGILILEDILAVTLLVLLSGVAVGKEVEILEMWKVTFVIAVFAAGVYFAGRVFAPRLLKALEHFDDHELVTIWSVALMLALGTLAIHLHLSVALGAFLAGSILSQSNLAQRIEHVTEPLRYVFCAVFFVAVGMMIEPGEIIDQGWQILLLALLVVFIKVSTVWFGLFLGGQQPDTSFRASVVKGQIGEFSFIIASLAQSLKVADSGLMSLAVGVSVLTTIFSLFLTQHADSVYGKLAKKMPPGLRIAGEFYQNLSNELSMRMGRNLLLMLLKRPLLQILLFFLLLNAIILSTYVFNRYIAGHEDWGSMRIWLHPASWMVAAICCLPFVIAMLRNLNAIVLIVADSLSQAAPARQYMRGRLQNIFASLSVAGLAIIVGGIYLSAAAEYLPSGLALLAFALLVLGASVFFWRRLINVNSRLEYLFMQSFNQRAREEDEVRSVNALEEISSKYPWPVLVRELILPANSRACGTRLIDLKLREETGATLIALSRNGQVLYDPEPTARLFPYDRLFLFGEQTQTEDAVQLLSEKRAEGGRNFVNPTLEVEKVFLPRDSILVEETLASAHLRRNYAITVLGIQRGETRITSPGPGEILRPGDVLYVIGDAASIRTLQEKHPRRERPAPEPEDVLSGD